MFQQKIMPPSNSQESNQSQTPFGQEHAFIIPNIAPRSEADNVLLDATQHYLVEMSLEELLMETKSIIDIGTLLKASPVLFLHYIDYFCLKAWRLMSRILENLQKLC